MAEHNQLPDHNPDRELPVTDESVDDEIILKILAGYKAEAEQMRKAGPAGRDTVWEENWNRYWLRYDHSHKADWQSKHIMPEVPQFVDRWAAAMREALTQGGRWFRVIDPGDQNRDLTPHVEKFVEMMLGRCAMTPSGHPTDFESVFEDQMKLGALMTCCAAVTWKEGRNGGRVAVDSVDPREVWIDAKMRNLYRIRRLEIDKHELMALAKETDDGGDSIYNTEVIAKLATHISESERTNREASTGYGQEQSSTRRPIVLDEYLCTIITPEGDVAADNALVVVANDKFLIRGPEDNPFWHGHDWIVTTPMVDVPFSVYGRSYAEDWGQVADAFKEMTNLILDATFTTSMNAYAVNANLLEDPTEIDEGVSPNKVFQLAEDVDNIKEFLREIDLGSLNPEAVTIWQALKQEMREGAKLNEIALGQVPPKGDITATEVAQVQQSGSAMIRSMARTIESRFLEPILTLVWQTGLQHVDFEDEQVKRELGEDTAAMLQSRKEEFRDRNFKFRVRGISSLVDRQMKLRNLLSFLQTVAQSDMLLQAFFQNTSPETLMLELMRLFGVDPLDFESDGAQKFIQQLMAYAGQGQPGAEAPERSGSPPRPRQAPAGSETP